MFLTENGKKVEKQGKEAIHSGQFMVSHFEAEAQDDDEIAVPIPDIPLKDSFEKTIKPILYNSKLDGQLDVRRFQPIGIETSLSKLFQCMSIAYRQKLTSPKWNRFRGIRLRWKDKIRLNNVIWRCWHMQFIKKQNTLICQFASPLDVDTHNKPEAIVMEGKYWKRKLEAVTAEYKKWRMFYKNQSFGYIKDANDLLEMELMKCELSNSEADGMLIDEDYMGLMSDTLFSTITNHPFAFPDTRELAKAGLADFIQPSLGPLQPNLPNNDFMDTIEHLDLLSGKLPTVPEENGSDVIYNKSLGWDYSELMSAGPPLQLSAQNIMEQYQQLPVSMNSVPIQSNRQTLVQYDNEIMMQPTVDAYISRQPQTYQSPVISSKSSKQMKDLPPSQVKPNTSSLGSTVFSKSLETVYCNYSLNNIESNISVTDPLRSKYIRKNSSSYPSLNNINRKLMLR
ncbi:hypothetical protein QE152_g38421 [Popillia japonica]|uniref:MLX-interacting protein n=1 Tax=Popillia japonica TaxID=7064 RepID=A0AAW1HWY7_POPJA